MTVDLQELADRLELRRIVEAYAHGADRRDAAGMAALFSEGGRLVMYSGRDATLSNPVSERAGRAQLEESFRGLDRWEVTTHFVGQQSVEIDGDTARGETYCLAHHLYTVDGKSFNRVLSIRYLDEYVRVAGVWLIDIRRFVLDWLEYRFCGDGEMAPPWSAPRDAELRQF